MATLPKEFHFTCRQMIGIAYEALREVNISLPRKLLFGLFLWAWVLNRYPFGLTVPVIYE